MMARYVNLHFTYLLTLLTLRLIYIYKSCANCSVAGESESKLSNVRRENKLYSYKEQMAEIELRRVRQLHAPSTDSSVWTGSGVI